MFASILTKLKQKFTSKKPGDISHVLYRARLEQAYRERAYILAYQNATVPRKRFSWPKRTVAAFLAFVLIVTSLSFITLDTSASTFSFAQTDWAGGTDGGVYPVHPGDQTGWNKYDSKDAGITAAGGNLALTLTTTSNTQTSYSDFNGGTKTNVTAVNNSTRLASASTNYTWNRNNPIQAGQYGAVWDTVNNVMYVYGRTAGELWKFTPSTNIWTLLTPSGGTPAATGRMSMAWDSTNSRFYMFGGSNGSNQLWYYTPSTNAWTQITDATGGPPSARSGAIGAWDPGNGRFYVYGGDGCPADMLWYYTPGSNTWTQLTPTNTPTEATSQSGVWDTVNNRLLVHAGHGSSTQCVNSANTGYGQLWAYRPATNDWLQLTGYGGDGNQGLSGTSALWDEANGRMYVFGGRWWTGSYVNTHKYYSVGSGTWTSASSTGPGGRSDHAAAWDPVNAKMYIFSGGNATDDWWTYTQSTDTWAQANDPPPTARMQQSTVWDTANNKMWVFGGSGNSVYMNDLWSYTPSAASDKWQQASPIGGPPGGRSSHTAVWDSQNNKMWVFGGCTASYGSASNDLWSYTPSTNTWAQASPTGGPPTARCQHDAAWDSQNNKMWVFGGMSSSVTRLNDLWSYTPSTNTWAQASPTGGPPSARIHHSTVWDPDNNKLWLFGGGPSSGVLNDLWSYTPSTNTWADAGDPSPPAARQEHSSAWDTLNGKMWIMGGSSGGTELWSYTPATNTWAQLTPTGSALPNRNGHTAAWDSQNDKMYVFGNTSQSDDLYILSTVTTYQASGDLTSSNIDLGQNSNLTTLSWAGNVPTNTVLQFQIRSATTSGGLSSATWLGPTGSGDYYTSSGAAINSAHDGHRWVQYRAYLSTSDTSVTSTLNDLTVNFTYYPASATLTSSAYDTVDANNVLGNISWTENLPANTEVKFQVRTSSAGPTSDGDFIYALRGNSTTDFYRYSISGNSWSAMSSTPAAIGAGGALTRAGDFIYALRGNSTTDFYRYSISGNSWSAMSVAPGTVTSGASIAYPGAGDYIYALQGNSTANFWRYSISGNSWSGALAAAPATISFGSSLISDGSNYLYALRGGGNTTFYRYSISADTWSTMAVTPDTMGANSCVGHNLSYAGTGDFIYATRSGITTDFYRYSISGNSWSAMASTLASFCSGGAMAFMSNSGHIYAMRGNAATDFYRYSISGNSWSAMASAPAAISSGGALVSGSPWTAWMGPDGTSSTYFTNASGGEAMPSAVTTGNDDQWIQYRVFLESSDGISTPTLSDVALSYVVNAAPTVSNGTANQAANGIVTIGYDLADTDTASSTIGAAVNFGITLGGDITNSATSLTVSSASSLPASGSIIIDNEEILYASKTGNTLNSLTRSRSNTFATTHSTGAAVFFKGATVVGDVGAGIANGTGKSLTWTIASDLTGVNTATAQVKIIANDGNLANQLGSATVSNVAIDTLAAATGTASSVQANATSSTSVTVTWTTDESSNSFVDYGTTTAYGTTASNATMTTSHSVVVSGLTASTQYFFRIRSTDAFNNTLTDDNGGASYTFTTPASDAGASRPVDETPPVISNVQVTNIATNGVTITWTTDEEASSLVNYGLDNTYGSIAGVPDIFTIQHSVSVSGLIPGTVYHYQVLSLDRNSNRTASTDATFTTAIGTGSGTGDGTGSGATADALEEAINELTNENSALSAQITQLNAQLGSAISEDEAGRIRRDLENLRAEIDNNIKRISELSAIKNKVDELEARNQELENQISEITNKILGLKDGESLKPADLLRLVSRKFNDLARVFRLQATVEERAQIEEELAETTSTLKELTELVPPPRVMTRPAIEVTSATATITWTTDKLTYGSVLYGDDASFRANGSYASQANDASGLATSHSVTLSGLTPATLYHYQIAAKSEAGAETNSADFAFTTKTASPIISNGRVIRVNDSTLQVLWQTTLPSNSVVTYTPYVNGSADSTQSLSEGKPELTANHNVTVSGLKPATTYDIEISSTDAFGNTVTERLGRVVTSEDKIPPVISQVRTEISVIPGSQNRVQVIISWRTDEPGTTQVFYAPGAATGAAADQLKQASNLNSELTYNHIAVITNWEPGIIYRFRAVSKDETGNEAQSKTFTVLTPRQKATVVDLIIDNFTDIFGWTQSRR